MSKYCKVYLKYEYLFTIKFLNIYNSSYYFSAGKIFLLIIKMCKPSCYLSKTTFLNNVPEFVLK